MKYVVVLFLLLAVVSGFDEKSFKPFQSRWKLFTKQHNKVYKNLQEENLRKLVFMDNVVQIDNHNAKYETGETTYRARANKFADMTDEEFKKYIGTDQGLLEPPAETRSFEKFSIEEVCSSLRSSKKCIAAPDYVNWTKVGAVTPVKDQGGCGACWAFSTVGAIESQLYINTKKLRTLSEQQLVDCAYQGNYNPNNGCSGGLMVPSFRYVLDNKGITTSKAYPYQQKRVECRYKKRMPTYKIKGYLELPRYDENTLKYAVANLGPVSVVVDASRFFFKFYDGGVFKDPLCSSTRYDHAVLLVGYGTEKGEDYWLIKNQWGTDWGKNGYLKLARNRNNTCSIASLSSIPLLYKGK